MKQRIRWRQPYDLDSEEREGAACAIETGSESLVQQAPSVDADINVIVKRFGISERMPVVPADPRFYGDLGDVPDLGTALRRVNEARDRFMALPVDLRNRFQNSPAVLWDFVNNPANAEEAVRLGLLRRLEEGPAPGLGQSPASGESGVAATS